MNALKAIGGGILALVLLLAVWGFAIEPRFTLDQQEHEAEVPGLSDAWAGERVALIADLQVGMWLDNTGMIERTVEAAVEADPALILLAGDFVYSPDSATVDHAVELVRPLVQADAPVVAVLGNHDYSLMDRQSETRPEMAAYLEQQLEAVGITVLENESMEIPARAGEGSLHLVGIGSEWAGRSSPGEALAGVPADAPRIVFMHNPVAYRDMPAGSAPLTLAAHTHGGQIRIPLTPSESWLDIARDREVVADGWAVDSIGAAGNRLYVNRGVGFSAVPVRIFCRPELTLFTLRPAGGTLPERGPDSAWRSAPGETDRYSSAIAFSR